jgi:hypothetical protein
LRQSRAVLTAASIALAACATTSPALEAEALRGCWIERRGAETVTMRWFPTADASSSWTGDLLTYRPGGPPEASQFTIVPAAGEREQWGWALCPQEEPTNPPCRALIFGDGEIEGEVADWFEVRAGAETLKIAFEVSGGEGFTLFDGRRDGCD